MYDVAEILKYYNEYGSIREVQRRTRISRNTIAKYLARVEENKKDQSLEIIRSKQRTMFKRTNELISLVNTLLEENKSKHVKLRYTAKKVWNIVVSQGYNVSYTTVKRVVKQWVRQKGPKKEIYIEQIAKPGIRAEFDWGYTPLIINGKEQLYPTVFMVLNKSLYRYAKVFERESQLEVIQAHIDFFNEIGGVPKTIFYDNLKTVVDKPGKIINENFLKFASFFNFTPNACNPYSPNEKGTDEETVGMVRNSCFSEKNDFDSLDDANKYLKDKLCEINSMHVYKRELTPRDGLINEQDFLNPLPCSSYNNYYLAVRNVNKYSMVSFETNFYSVPETFTESKVMLKVYPDKIELVGFDDNIVATHTRLFSRNNYSLDILHYLQTIRQKPRALANSRALQTIGGTLKALFEDYYTTNPKDFIDILSLIKSYDEEHLANSIKALMQNGVIPTQETIQNLLEQKETKETESFYYPGISIEIGEPSVYDKLLSEV